MQELFSTVCFMQEVIRWGFKICDLSIIGNVASTWYDIYVYKHLGGGVVEINCMIYATIVSLETGMAL